MVKVARKMGPLRNVTMTDANGKFALRGLTKGLTMLYARALDIKQTAQHADCRQRRSRTTFKFD